MSAIEADLPQLRKARGAFFTPPNISEFIALWAIRSSTDKVLEPSCGEASFLLPAGAHLRSLGAPDSPTLLFGHDIHAASVDAAHLALREAGLAAEIEVGDFFSRVPEQALRLGIDQNNFSLAIRYQHRVGGRFQQLPELSFRDQPLDPIRNLAKLIPDQRHHLQQSIILVCRVDRKKLQNRDHLSSAQYRKGACRSDPDLLRD